MEFATLDKMVEKLEEEKEAYVKQMDEQIAAIKRSIQKMKEEYRKETMPEASSMIEYIRQCAEKRFEGNQSTLDLFGGFTLGGKHSNFQPVYAFEGDINKSLIDDFYEASKRKINKKKIIMMYQNTATDYLFFFEKSFYLYQSFYRKISEYSYKGLEVRNNGISSSIMKETYDIWSNGEFCDVLTKFIDTNKGLARFLLDLRDYANRS